MKRLALVAAVLVIAACATKESKTDSGKLDTAALAPAPAVTDSAKMDSAMKHDSSMMKADTTKKKP